LRPPNRQLRHELKGIREGLNAQVGPGKGHQILGMGLAMLAVWLGVARAL